MHVQTTPLTVTQHSYSDSFVPLKKNLLIIVKMVGYSDTPLIVTVLAVPEGVTVSEDICNQFSLEIPALQLTTTVHTVSYHHDKINFEKFGIHV